MPETKRAVESVDDLIDTALDRLGSPKEIDKLVNDVGLSLCATYDEVDSEKAHYLPCGFMFWNHGDYMGKPSWRLSRTGGNSKFAFNSTDFERSVQQLELFGNLVRQGLLLHFSSTVDSHLRESRQVRLP